MATEVELVGGDDVGHAADARVELFVSELADDLHTLHLGSIGAVLFADKADDDKVGLGRRYPEQVSAWVLREKEVLRTFVRKDTEHITETDMVRDLVDGHSDLAQHAVVLLVAWGGLLEG